MREGVRNGDNRRRYCNLGEVIWSRLIIQTGRWWLVGRRPPMPMTSRIGISKVPSPMSRPSAALLPVFSVTSRGRWSPRCTSISRVPPHCGSCLSASRVRSTQGGLHGHGLCKFYIIFHILQSSTLTKDGKTWHGAPARARGHIYTHFIMSARRKRQYQCKAKESTASSSNSPQLSSAWSPCASVIPVGAELRRRSHRFPRGVGCEKQGDVHTRRPGRASEGWTHDHSFDSQTETRWFYWKPLPLPPRGVVRFSTGSGKLRPCRPDFASKGRSIPRSA